MTRHTLMGLAALLASAQAWAATYTVTHNGDQGAGSLRQCVMEANASGYGDLITFSQAMVIQPLTELPTVFGAGDTINGDINDDGHPEVILDGRQLAVRPGLEIAQKQASTREASAGTLTSALLPPPISAGSKIIGLAIMRFLGAGIWIHDRDGNTVRSCYIGVTLFGDGALPNGQDAIVLQRSGGNTIGGVLAKHRNLICSSAGNSAGVHIIGGEGNRVQGNHFGLDWSGMYGIGQGGWHVYVALGQNNRIGGAEAGARNLFGGDYEGVGIYSSSGTAVQGNWFGLGSDGNKAIPMGNHVVIVGGSTQSLVGGARGGGNVFGAGTQGVHIADAGTRNNTVQGNCFGSNAAGTVRRALAGGVLINSGAGKQTIGTGNVFTLSTRDHPSVILSDSGAETTVKGNTFGALPNGRTVGAFCGVSISGVLAYVTGNLFADAQTGVKTVSPTANGRIFRNTFRGCGKGVWIQSGLCMMGNLANDTTTDDGGNVFKRSNTWHIYNNTEAGLKAEGNSFGTTVKAEIDAKIYDALDDPDKGRVDFVPLAGGAMPTGGPGGLAISGASAARTGRGVAVTFTLSAPAAVTVEVLNVAGRLVAQVAQERVCPAGTQQVPWSGRTSRGTSAPPGTYLMKLTACSADGERTAAVVPVNLRR
jgi:FlgD Ig-like domain